MSVWASLPGQEAFAKPYLYGSGFGSFGNWHPGLSLDLAVSGYEPHWVRLRVHDETGAGATVVLSPEQVAELGRMLCGMAEKSGIDRLRIKYGKKVENHGG